MLRVRDSSQNGSSRWQPDPLSRCSMIFSAAAASPVAVLLSLAGSMIGEGGEQLLDQFRKWLEQTNKETAARARGTLGSSTGFGSASIAWWKNSALRHGSNCRRVCTRRRWMLVACSQRPPPLSVGSGGQNSANAASGRRWRISPSWTRPGPAENSGKERPTLGQTPFAGRCRNWQAILVATPARRKST